MFGDFLCTRRLENIAELNDPVERVDPESKIGRWVVVPLFLSEFGAIRSLEDSSRLLHFLLTVTKWV